MSRKLVISLVIALLLLAGVWAAWDGSASSQPAQDNALLAGYTFTGHVYQGYKPSAATPLSGVSVGLWGDQDEWPEGGSFTRVQLATTTTNASGAFSLNWTPGDTRYLYLHVIEVDPTGYWSTGAEAGSSPGYVKNYNCISYYAPRLEQNTTYSGIGYWDERNATATPTRTTPPRYTPTATATRPPGNTPTITATSTRPTGPTPTPTNTPRVPLPTPTATATAGCPPFPVGIEKRLMGHPSNQAAIGETLTFAITLTNLSTVAVPAVGIRDTYPTAYFELAPGQAFSGWGDLGTAEWVQWTSYGPGGSGFAPGQSHTVLLQLKAIAQGSATEAVNEAAGWLAPFEPCQGTVVSTSLGVEIGCAELPIRVAKTLTSHPSGAALVGDTLSFYITATNTSSTWVPSLIIYDHFPTAYFDLAPGQVFDGSFSLPGEMWVARVVSGGPWGAGITPGLTIGFSIELIAKAPAANTEAVNHAMARLENPGCPSNWGQAEAGVTIRRAEGNVRVTKTLIDSPTGTGAVGDIARFRIHVENVGNAAATVNLEDTFADADFDFVSAMPAPTDNLSDGVTHLLRWVNVVLLPGAPSPGSSMDFTIDLRIKQPGTLANCAHWTTSAPAGAVGLLGPDSCAEVRVPLNQEHDIAVLKYFTSPTNHLANVGDKLSFQTGMKTLGAGAIESFSVHDYFVPSTIGNAGDWWLDYTWSMGPPTMFAPGFSAGLVGLSVGPVVAPAYPAWNIAEWTATWPDGYKITKTAKDYVIISDKQSADGLVIRKELLAPKAGLTVSDTVEFRITIVNVSGAPLPITPLGDNYDPACLRYLGAFPPPDSVGPGVLQWANLGLLLPGQSVSVIARFHAEAPCLATLNCAGTQDARQSGAIAVDCLPLDIAGPRPEVRLTKTRLSPSPAPVGSVVEYRLRLENVGGVPISSYGFHDMYDFTRLDFDSAVPAPSYVNPPTGYMEWGFGTLMPGQVIDIIVRLRAISPGVNVHNGARFTYLVGGFPQGPSVTELVDIYAPGPAVRLTKERTIPSMDVPVGVGEAVVFKITVHNVGSVPLNPLRVDDNLDPACLEFLSSAIPPVLSVPGHIVWDLPALPPGGSASWEIVLRALSPCGEVANCAHVVGYGPDGAPVEDAACAPVRIAPPEPGVRVNKYIKLLDMPVVGDVVQFRINVGNTGNITLVSVPLTDHYNPSCFEFVSALPAPDAFNPTLGEIIWNNLGPLAPGGVANIKVWLRVKRPCSPSENCAWTRAMDAFGRVVESRDCAEIYTLSAGPRAIYLPLVLKQFPR